MVKQDSASDLNTSHNLATRPTLPLFNALLNSYSIIIFSKNRWLGLILILSTLNTPFVGICGIIGTLVAIIGTRALKFTTWEDDSGFYSFNSLLVSLGIAYFYPYPGEGYLFFFIILGLCSIVTAILWVAVNQFFQSHIGLQSLSIAFVIVMSFVCFVYNRLTGLPLSIFHHAVLLNWNPSISTWLSMYFRSMGSIFFQTNLVSGIVVAIVVLLYSRIGLLLSIMGFGAGYYFLTMNTVFTETEIMLAGFNIILNAIVIGGVFLVPSIISFIIAAIASLSGALIGIAIQSALYNFGIPPLAIPFNFTVLVILYAFKMRIKNSNPYLIDFYASSPEDNLEYYYSNIIRFYQEGLPQFFLPFNGEWTVTQGHNGKQTHKLQWRWAWDFEIVDEMGSKCRGSGTTPKDYYCFDKPVIAPANGTVVKVVDGIQDNPINQINPRENWGNLIVIQHGIGIFSLLCHLKQGSIEVQEGQYVRASEILARCGNSGRSTIPHLHFQLQGTPEPGSLTIKANLVNYIIKNKNPKTFVYSGIPQENETIVALQAESRLQDMLNLKVGDKYEFQTITQRGKSFNETWNVEVDLWGNTYINGRCGFLHKTVHGDGLRTRFTDMVHGRGKLGFSVYNGIFNLLNFNGKFHTALQGLALCLPRFPFTDEPEYSWEDNPPLSVVLSTPTKLIVDFLSFITRPLTLKAKYTAIRESTDTIIIHGKLNLNLINYTISTLETRCVFSTDKGIIELYLSGPHNFTLKANRLES